MPHLYHCSLIQISDPDIISTFADVTKYLDNKNYETTWRHSNRCEESTSTRYCEHSNLSIIHRVIFRVEWQMLFNLVQCKCTWTGNLDEK